MLNENKCARLIEVGDYADCKDLPKNSIVITATQNLKNNDLFKETLDIMSFSDIIFLAKKNINAKDILTNNEFKYLIHTMIDKLYEQEKGQTYTNCTDSLVELFNKLVINKVEESQLKNIKSLEEYSFVEEDIFNIYTETIRELKRSKRKIFNESLIEEICKILNGYENVVFVGFVFLNDIQEATIKNLCCQNLYFVNKRNDFISTELFMPLLQDIGRKVFVQKQDIVNQTDFMKIEECLFTNKQAFVDIDEKIEVYDPFTNREDEFLFIAKSISDSLKEQNLSPTNYEKALKDYAVVITKNKEELVKILNDAFGQYGLFIPNEQGYENIKPVYFSKQEFLDSDILCNHRSLTHIEKIKAFNKFKRINVTGISYRSIDYPIGKFVVEIYKILAEGLTFERFKNLINTNWYLNNTADVNALKDISIVDVYFNDLLSLDEWAKQVRSLIDLKSEVNKHAEFSRHPLYVINSQSLDYIKTYIEFLQNIVSKLKINGSMKQQIQNLIETFGLSDIKAPTKEEQEILESFVMMLKNIDAGDNLSIDHTYFANHIEELFLNYYELLQRDGASLRLNVVNMENYTKYKYVYFPMFEDNKYPRVLKEKFPYTNSIVSILSRLNINLPKNQQMGYHLKMSRHIFRNVFSFTEKKLTFTYVNFENGMDIGVSTYAYDVFKAAGKQLSLKKREQLSFAGWGDREIKFYELKTNDIYLNQLFYRDLCPKMFYYNCKHKNLISYSSEFLLHFYAKSLLVNTFFTRLSLLNKEYFISDNDFSSDVEKVFQDSLRDTMQFFQFFNESAVRDIEITSKKQINDFIDLHIKHGKFATKHFRLELGKEKEIKIFDTIVKVRKTMVLVDLVKRRNTEFDISKGLDFIVSSCGGKKYDFAHYDEIMDKLLKCSKYDDKMALVNFASFKVNTQLNNEKYKVDGEKRVKDLVYFANKDVSNYGDSVSSFCRFCPLNNMCKEVLVDDK